ncbi:hypothetical protein CROQUDRAFT_45387 [Cronartium quercuum f. sp. fusiforme G11]|uniref:Uncharacterized protein n=1 Tax=Cronartium quercuum f. sp. fusiforme G11 TaxID=708437 RepID=A0A9P6TBJ2_9BASI|nr:hypothetical protein CROQUDRAFT_45387 [Cronartium quercuum f. sp. fusiforme G11]
MPHGGGDPPDGPHSPNRGESNDPGIELIKSWRSVDYDEAQKQLEQKKVDLIKLHREAFNTKTEELTKLAEVKDLKKQMEAILNEKLKSDPKFRQKLSKVVKELETSQEPFSKEAIKIIEQVKIQNRSKPPAFFRWLIKVLWKNPRDYIWNLFSGKSYRRFRASGYLKKLVADKTFKDREDIQSALSVLQQMKKSELTDDHNRLIILLKKEGLKDFEEKHQKLISDILEKSFKETMSIQPKARRVADRHVKYLMETLNNLQFTDEDKYQLVKLEQIPIESLEVSQKAELEKLENKESLSIKIRNELEQSHYFTQKMVLDADLTRDEKDLLVHMYEHPEKLKLSKEEISDGERELILELENLKAFRNQFISEQKAEVFLLQDQRETKGKEWPERKAEILKQLRKNHKTKTGPKLTEGSERESIEAFSKRADEYTQSMKLPSREKTKTGEALVNPSSKDLFISEPAPSRVAEDMKAIRALKELNAGGSLRLETQLMISKLQNRPLVITKAEQNQILLAAKNVQQKIKAQSQIDKAGAMLELGAQNHFFPLDEKSQNLLQKIRLGEDLDLHDSIMIISLAREYSKIVEELMTEPEQALLAVRKYGHVIELPTDQAQTLEERIERYSVSPDEYYTIKKVVDKQLYFTQAQWFLSLVDHAKRTDTPLGPDVLQLKDELENSGKAETEVLNLVEAFNNMLEGYIKKVLAMEPKLVGNEDYVKQAMDLIGNVKVGSTEFERLQLISQMSGEKIELMFKVQDQFPLLLKLVEEAEDKVRLIKKFDSAMMIYDKEARILIEKVALQRAQSLKSEKYLEYLKNFFNRQLNALDLDHKLLESTPTTTR